MVWNAKTQCMWLVTLMIMAGSSSVALKCVDNCNGCSTTSVTCYSHYNMVELKDIVSVLPPDIQSFSYVASGSLVGLYDYSFKHLTELKVLNITSNDTLTHSLFFIISFQQNVFVPLAKLQILKIHVTWDFHEPIDDLFRPLLHLQELDLSQTIALNITNLRRALYGLSNSTKLKTIKLSNIHEKGYDIYSTLNLTWFLEPLQNCPIRHLHLANNSLHAIYPGIIRYTPLLEYIDVSHNLLLRHSTDSVATPFFHETLLHKGLQEIDFSYQGFDSCHNPHHEEQTRGLLGSNPNRFTNRRRDLSTGTFQQTVTSLVADDVIFEHWLQCFTDACGIFRPNCSGTIDYLRLNHGQFCEFMYASHMYPREISCLALPALDDIYQQQCINCIAEPIMGSTKRLINRNINENKFNNLDTQMHRALCFHQSNQLEYLDLSGNTQFLNEFLPFDQQFTILGLKHIKELNVSNTGITRVRAKMLLNFPNLQVMDMSRKKNCFLQ